MNKKIETTEKVKVVISGDFRDEVGTHVVKIEDGIEEIGENAFRDFENLEELFIPSSVKRIRAAAFSGCKNLKRVSFSLGLIEIDDEAFSSCPSITEIEIPDTCKRIGEGAFEGCAALGFVKLSSEVEMIGASAFAYCFNLREIMNKK